MDESLMNAGIKVKVRLREGRTAKGWGQRDKGRTVDNRRVDGSAVVTLTQLYLD